MKKFTDMKLDIKITAISTLIGIIFLAYNIYSYREYASVIATVTDVRTETYRDNSSGTVKMKKRTVPTITFYVSNGDSVTYLPSMHSGVWHKGEKVPLIYHPTNPDESVTRAQFFYKFPIPSLSFAVALISLLLGKVIARNKIKIAQRTKRRKQNK